jgi:pimeloyl-ACP methyl ester carboxylesterase
MDESEYKQFSSQDGILLAYRTAGDGRRVVLLHGFTVSSTTNFATCYSDDGSGGLLETAGATVESASVDSGCEVALLDLRGHGYSDKPHDPKHYSIELSPTTPDPWSTISDGTRRLSLAIPLALGSQNGS